MSKKKSAKQKVTDYRMSVHFGVCAGPVDWINEIKVKDKTVFSGKIVANDQVVLNQPNLFGGPNKEGGVTGHIQAFLGHSTQVLSDLFATKFGRTSSTMPAFRGLTSLFFHGGANTQGFTWGANTPYLPSVQAKVCRVPRAWYPAKAPIGQIIPNTRRAIYISIDRSGSMAIGSRWATMKTAMASVLSRIEDAILNDGLDIDIVIRFWSDDVVSGGYNHAEVTEIQALAAWVDSMPTGSGTNFLLGVSGAADFFESRAADTSISKRVFVFITDGEPTSGYAEAVATVATMTDVERYGINVVLEDTTYTAGIDNTPDDGVPVIDEDDPSGLTAVIESALFTSGFNLGTNPAHIIYECLTDSTWGMGASPASLDDDAFQDAADTLYGETFGMSLLWTRQAPIEDFVGEILDHIEAVLFVSPKTGLMKLKLLRDDYVLEDTLILDADNCEISNLQRKSEGDLINEIVVTWTNPENEEEETVTMQDLGGITRLGSIVSDGRNYYGVRDRSLAMRLAARDLAAGGYPIATCSAEIDRTAWDIEPGDVVRLRVPEYGIAEMVMRVGKVDYGRPGAPTVKVDLMEDLFSRPVPHFDEPVGSAWEPMGQEPAPAAHTLVTTLPSYLAGRLTDTTDAAYPEVWAGILAAQTGTDTSVFTLMGQTVDTLGAPVWEALGDRAITSRGTLSAGIPQEAETTLPEIDGMTQGGGATIGGFVMFEGADETEHEFGLISDYVDGWVVYRGVLDTTPKTWPADTPVWFFSADSAIQDDEERSAFEEVQYKVLPVTSMGTLADDTPISGTLTERPWLPLRPANVTVNTVGFGSVDLTDPLITDVTVAWATRNRLLEDSTVLPWTAAAVTPEDGQTTTVLLLDADDLSVLDTHAAIAGGDLELVKSELPVAGRAIFRVVAVRDDLDSLQGHEILVVWASAPENTVAPVVDVTAGEASYDEGTWLYEPTSFTQQWYRHATAGGAGSAISGETGATYTLTEDDNDHWISVEVVGINATGSSDPVASNRYGPIEVEESPIPDGALAHGTLDELDPLSGILIEGSTTDFIME